MEKNMLPNKPLDLRRAYGKEQRNDAYLGQMPSQGFNRNYFFSESLLGCDLIY
ncbi:MAG: hypothetical protein AABY04_00430 [Candidatus Micrarchaeota archaeon]